MLATSHGCAWGRLNIQWVLFNAYNQPKPWTVRYPVEFSNKTIAVSTARYNGDYSFSESFYLLLEIS